MKKSLIIDLDGTLLNTNTFKDYIKYIFNDTLKKRKFLISVQIVVYVILRKLRIISHECMKKHILKSTSPFMSYEKLKKFTQTLYRKENLKVVELLLKYKAQNYLCILSTAAPESYATIIANHYGFDNCIATPNYIIKNSWKENVKENKKENTIKFLKRNNASLNIFITDHHDDLPLLKIPKEINIMVNPNIQTQQILKENHIIFTSI